MDLDRTMEQAGAAAPSRSLPDAAHSALRAALGAHLRGSPADLAVPTAQLRRALRLLCDDARQRGVRAEQLVVAIKQAWLSLPESAWRAGDDRGTEFMQRIVSMCIEEYYAGRAAGDGDRAPVGDYRA